VSDTAVVAFSKDRPLQLDFGLFTFFDHCEDYSLCDKFVLYKVSDDRYRKAYNKVIQNYPHMNWVEENDFSKNLYDIIKNYKYVLFLVDDNIFIGDFEIKEITSLLEKAPTFLGFSLRLGKNVNYCYSLNQSSTLPFFAQANEGMFQNILFYSWLNADPDFNYPLELSSSIYRVRDVIDIIRDPRSNNPNNLEWNMYLNLYFYANSHPFLACYEQSVAFCNPINKVQEINRNRYSNLKDYSPLALLEKFEEGYMIDESKFNFIPNSCHVEVRFLDE
jgi:hypothetical protein